MFRAVVGLVVLFLSFSAAEAAIPAKVSVLVKVPHPGWSVQILEIRKAGGKLLILSKLTEKNGVFPQVIATAGDSVKILGKEYSNAQRNFMIGKTWKWKNQEKIEFSKTRKSYDELVKKTKAKLLY